MNVLIPNQRSFTDKKENNLAEENIDLHTDFQSLLQSNQTTNNESETVQSEIYHDVDFMPSHSDDLLNELLNVSDNLLLAEEMIEDIPVKWDIDMKTIDFKTENMSIFSREVEVIHDEDRTVMDEPDAKMTDVLVNADNPIYQQLVILGKEIANLIDESSKPINQSEKVSRLLTLLQNLTSLKQEIGDSELSRITTKELSDREAKILHHLVNLYEKRTHFTNKQVYQSESTITKTDVLKWVQQAIRLYQEPKESTTVIVPSNQSIPISEIEQYTIHVNQLQRVERVSEELVHKFQNIISNSRFIQTPQTGKQLSIMLQPENLGNLTVRLMQVDGEITVKIIVTSQAAREILESNIHQLKHMFSPHQVLIEREETVSDEEYLYEESEENNQDDDEEPTEQYHDSDENKNGQTTEVDFNDWLERVSEGEFLNE